jgi:hypothetical protein
MTSWFSINTSIKDSNKPFFNGYFSVNDSTKIIQSFYDGRDKQFNNNLLLETQTWNYLYSKN